MTIEKKISDLTPEQAGDLRPGDRVQTIGCIEEDSDAGVVHEVRTDGTALVGWDSGVVTPCDLASLELMLKGGAP